MSQDEYNLTLALDLIKQWSTSGNADHDSDLKQAIRLIIRVAAEHELMQPQIAAIYQEPR